MKGPKFHRGRLGDDIHSCFPSSLSGQQGKRKSAPYVRFDGTFRASTLKGMEEAYIPRLYASSHAANLLQLKNNDILCFWFSGKGEGHFNGIVMSRLTKGSRQWSAPVQVTHQNNRSFQNPVAFQLPSGEHLASPYFASGRPVAEKSAGGISCLKR